MATANKTFQGRIQQKADISTNWAKATNFTPLLGELILYTDLNKIKIGDGSTLVGNLPFLIGETDTEYIKVKGTETGGDYRLGELTFQNSSSDNGVYGLKINGELLEWVSGCATFDGQALSMGGSTDDSFSDLTRESLKFTDGTANASLTKDGVNISLQDSNSNITTDTQLLGNLLFMYTDETGSSTEVTSEYIYLNDGLTNLVTTLSGTGLNISNNVIMDTTHIPSSTLTESYLSVKNEGLGVETFISPNQLSLSSSSNKFQIYQNDSTGAQYIENTTSLIVLSEDEIILEASKINLNSQTAISLTPTEDTDVTNKKYVDNQISKINTDLDSIIKIVQDDGTYTETYNTATGKIIIDNAIDEVINDAGWLNYDIIMSEDVDGDYMVSTMQEGGAVLNIMPDVATTGPYTIEFYEEEEDSFSASSISYSNTNSKLSAVNVQDAIDELKTNITSVTTEINTLDTAISANSSEIATLSNSVSVNTSNITALQTELDNLVTDVWYAGTTAPSNTKLLWIDTNETTGGLRYYNTTSGVWAHVPVAWT